MSGYGILQSSEQSSLAEIYRNPIDIEATPSKYALFVVEMKRAHICINKLSSLLF